MARPDRTLIIALAGLLLAAPAAALAQQAAGAPDVAASRDPRVKFRDGDRYLRDLADGLEIPRDEICRELSKYDCNDEAFGIVLGGVDPYEVRLLAPLEHASVASPIAFDRVALQVCVNRVQRDADQPAAAILFKPTSRADRAWMDRTSTAIYDRLLQREATTAEKTRLADFYRTVAAGRRDQPAIQKDWVVLSCFAVASSLESAFY